VHQRDAEGRVGSARAVRGDLRRPRGASSKGAVRYDLEEAHHAPPSRHGAEARLPEVQADWQARAARKPERLRWRR
jgi:hypothetical protein